MTSNKCLTSFFIMFIVYLSFLEGVFKGARNLYSPRTELDIWEMFWDRQRDMMQLSD